MLNMFFVNKNCKTWFSGKNKEGRVGALELNCFLCYAEQRSSLYILTIGGSETDDEDMR